MTDLQQTPEWFEARLGKHTASRHNDATARTKSGWGTSRERYIGELVVERLNREPYPHFQSLDMKWGNETQPLAAAAYSMLRDVDVVDVGFVQHPTIAMSGASPDGLVGDDGLIEIKCPASHTHISYLRGAPIPSEYIMQMQWQLISTGRKWCDWVSFDPRIKKHPRLQIEIRRIPRVSDQMVTLMEQDVRQFLLEVDQAQEELLAMKDEQ